MQIKPYNIQEILKCNLIQEVVALDTCSSTLDIAENWPQKKHKTLFLAESQTKGRGQNGRTWESPKYSGIWATLLFQSKEKAIAIKSAIALANALKKLGCPPTIQIKWPNDIYLANKKTAGILVEGCYQNKHQTWLLGIGVTYKDIKNLDIMPLTTHWANSCPREKLITTWIELFFKILPQKNIAEQFEPYDMLKNKKCFGGTAIGINNSGNLLIQMYDRSIKKLN